MRMMFHVPSAATRFNEGDFGQWHKVVCAALDRDALAGGSVELMASSFVSYGLDPLAVTEQQERGRAHMLRISNVGDWHGLPRLPQSSSQPP